jgi:hypothetical protein
MSHDYPVVSSFKLKHYQYPCSRPKGLSTDHGSAMRPSRLFGASPNTAAGNSRKRKKTARVVGCLIRRRDAPRPILHAALRQSELFPGPSLAPSKARRAVGNDASQVQRAFGTAVQAWSEPRIASCSSEFAPPVFYRPTSLPGLRTIAHSPTPAWPLFLMPTARVIPPLASTIFGCSEM